MRGWNYGLTSLALSVAVGAFCLPAMAAETEDMPPEELAIVQVTDPADENVAADEHGSAPEEQPKIEAEEKPVQEPETVTGDLPAAQEVPNDPAAVVEPQVQDGWSIEDGFYVYYRASVRQSGWLVVDVTPQGERGGLERYWLDDQGHLATGRLVTPDEAGFWAYATSSGKVARGYYRSSEGLVYLADNEGRLADPGWVVSNAYGQGLQRYFVDSDVHACVPGYSSDGYAHYTCAEGFVVRGKYASAEGLYLANNDGRIYEGGWVVTSEFGDGTQRYYVNPATHTCTEGYSADGWPHYTRPEGYVARGAYKAANGHVYLANNDGRLATGGWVVSSAYGHGVQRYWVDAAAHACIPGYSADGWPHYTRPEGYVVRGKYRAANGRVYLANNDGRLEADGWVVSSAYGDGIQRYYVEPGKHACVPGYAESGWPHYTRPEGYVARGAYKAANGRVYLADNDGRLATGGWVVSSAYGHGVQRYWVDAAAHACIPGYSADGWPHYTRPEGYVVRGMYTTGSTIWLANNDGRLANGGKGGWLVSSAYGQGLQRYYIDGGTHGISVGLNHEGSWWFYTRPEGYVVRGLYRRGNDIYLADNDGRLPSQTSNGWLVTSAYGQGLQRYYIYGATHAARYGYSTDGWPHFTTDKAYVLRGTLQYGGGVLLADIDGRLATSTGWLNSSAYGDGGRRYYLEACCTGGVIGARTGLFAVGSNRYYGYPNKGFIAQNTDVTINGIPYHADATGVLSAKYPQSVVSMAMRANNYSSGTGWLIMVDRSATKVAIFRGSRGSWTLNRWFDCTVGRAGAPTVSGTFSIGSRGYSFGESKGYSAYYWTQFYSDYLFHSVLYYPYSRNIQDGRLNGHLSAGCIRLQIDNAKWIHDNIPSGTTVNIV